MIWLGVGIWRTDGVPFGIEGTGEPSLAIESARGTDCGSAGELRPEFRDDEGTAFGFEDPEGRRPAILTSQGHVDTASIHVQRKQQL